MLVLTRRQQEKIRIGDNIIITVLRMKGKTIRLGIEAPSDVPVLRGELALKAKDENATSQACDTAGAVANQTPTREQEDSIGAIGSPRQSTSWASDANPACNAKPFGGSDRLREDGSRHEVSMQRMPRNQIARAIGIHAKETGPLKAMLDRR